MNFLRKIHLSEADRIYMGQRFRQLRRDLGLSQQQLVGQYSFPSQNALTRFERGQAKQVSWPLLAALARFLRSHGKSLDWLVTGTEPPSEGLVPPIAVMADAEADELLAAFAKLTSAEAQMVSFVRLADDKQARRRLAEALMPPDWQPPWPRLTAGERFPQRVDVDDLPRDWRGKYVPIVAGVAAGEGSDTVEAEQEAVEYVPCEGAPEGAFAVEVFGECMMPDYNPGDVVIADPRRRIESGVGVIVYGTEAGERLAQLRILRRDGGRVCLESRRRRPIEIPADRLIAAYAVWRHLPTGANTGPGAADHTGGQGA